LCLMTGLNRNRLVSRKIQKLIGEKYGRQNNFPRKTFYFKQILFPFPQKSAEPRPIPIPGNINSHHLGCHHTGTGRLSGRLQCHEGLVQTTQHAHTHTHTYTYTHTFTHTHTHIHTQACTHSHTHPPIHTHTHTHARTHTHTVIIRQNVSKLTSSLLSPYKTCPMIMQATVSCGSSSI
jgi:hypothetical protein